MTHQKIFGARVKAADEVDGEFIVEALVSVFGNVDSYGDVVMPGAFTTTLDEWKASGDPIPFVWSHQIGDIWAFIGTVVEARETDTGLWVKVQLDRDNPTAVQAYKNLKARRVKEFSFGYKVRRATRAERDGQGVQELHELELLEVSATLIGANPETELLDVKSAAAAFIGDNAPKLEAKAGRTLSRKNEDLVTEARDAALALAETLTALLASATAEDEAKASAGHVTNDEELPPAVKSDELPAEAPADEATPMSADDIDRHIKSINLTIIEGMFK